MQLRRDLSVPKHGGSARWLIDSWHVRFRAFVVDDTRGRERIEVGPSVVVQAGDAASDDGEVSCGIPGHDRPGTEVHAKVLAVDEAGFEFRYSGVCGFTTSFDYHSD